MTEPWTQAADEAIAHNVADVLKNGPRLAWDRKTAVIAIDRRAKQILETGLGCMGVGTAWHPYDDELAEWADLPEREAS
jgi:hypothetical protein